MRWQAFAVLAAVFQSLSPPALADAEKNGYFIAFPKGTTVCEYPDYQKPTEYRQAHADCATASGGLFASSPDEVTLFFGRGTKKSFASDLAACAREDSTHCIGYEVIAFNKERHFLILSEGRYEEGTYYLYDMRYGREFDLQERPIFSKTGDEIVVVNALDMGPRDHEIMVFDIGGESFRQTYMYNEPKYETWEFENWDDKDVIKLTRDGEPYDLVRNGASWIFPYMAPMPKPQP
jgi:hypothetical protein